MKEAVKDMETTAQETAAVKTDTAAKKSGGRKTAKAVKKPAAAETAKAAKKTAAAETEKKTAPAKKAALKETVYLQYLGKEINKDDLTKQVKEIWTRQLKRKVSELKTIELYLKPEDNMVYYVMNGEVTGSLEL